MSKYRVPAIALRMVRERTLSIPHVEISTAAEAAAVAVTQIGDRPVEHLLAIVLDGHARVTSIVTVGVGGMSGVACAARDVMRAVLMAHGAAFVLAHNHPGGDPTPSREDIAFTRKMREAADVVGLPMLDHVVVVANGEFRSVPS